MTPPAEPAASGSAGRALSAFQQIAASALESNLQRLTELSRLTSAAVAGSLTEDDSAEAAHLAHQLVGSAGTFGYTEVSQLARQLEGYFAARDFSPAVSTAASSWLQQMHEELSKDPQDGDDW